ncbi:hypothetical protein [Rhodopseudomonas sp.]|uniref:hypothetical protein n=1 Tax=Rhodopseudomonas sp. TaxID=1078 RepID=UPI003B3B6F5C
MASHNLPDIKRGRMTTADKAEIERLAAKMAKPTPGKIAAKINRHPATVNWFMLTPGLIEQKVGRAPRVYERNGKKIYPYAPEHDALLERLRCEGKSHREIAEVVTAKFGIHRTGHSVQVRIIQLSASLEDH